MSGFVVVLALLALLLLVFLGFCFLLGCETTEERVQRERASAEANIDAEHQAARRAMNDAAGQSWRNLAE